LTSKTCSYLILSFLSSSDIWSRVLCSATVSPVTSAYFTWASRTKTISTATTAKPAAADRETP
jgi:hypothetical protein